MKKIFLALIAAAFTLASCDMDKSPEGSTTDTDALNSVEKCKSFRNGLYTYMRSVTTGGFIILSEIRYVIKRTNIFIILSTFTITISFIRTEQSCHTFYS